MAIAVTKRSTILLYTGNADHYSHQVRIVLAEKNVNYELTDVTVDTAAMNQLIEVNPYASMPTLIDRDLVLYQPNIIMEYLDERFPHPPLLPIYPIARGQARLMLYGKHLSGPQAKSPEMQATHQSILSQVYFSNGAKAKDIVTMLEREGFIDINVQTRLTAIHRAQSSQMGLLKFLERSIQNRYAICAVRPSTQDLS